MSEFYNEAGLVEEAVL